jgi:hypothetical protein
MKMRGVVPCGEDWRRSLLVFSVRAALVMGYAGRRSGPERDGNRGGGRPGRSRVEVRYSGSGKVAPTPA